MSREILFKAKTCSGEWVEGLLAHKDDKWYISNKAGMPFAFEVRPETICQYTGLTDKGGNKIWENDIVERIDRRNGLYLFREQPKMNCKVVYTHRHGFDTEPSCGYFDDKSALECKVISNIFDNKELLEGGE